METVSAYSPYGWKAKIGLIIPSTNTVNEPEFWQMAPDGVTIHTARLHFRPKEVDDPLDDMEAHLPRAYAELAGAEVDIIAFSCTASSMHRPPEVWEQEIRAATGLPSVTVAGAVLEAIHALGGRTISFGTPYPEKVNEHEKAFFEARGIRVAKHANLMLSSEQQRLRHMSRIPPQAVFRLAQTIDTPDTDVIFLSCTDMASLPMIEEIEQALGKPCITSSQVTFWQALRRAGLKDRPAGFGRLFSEH